MSEMSPRERVMAAFLGKDTDQKALINPVTAINLECMKYANSYYPFAHMTTSKMVDLASTTYELLKFDSVMPYFGVTNEAYALGSEINWGNQNEIPYITKNAISKLEQFKKPANYLDQKPLRSIIHAIAQLKEKYGDQVAIIGKIVGPMRLIFQIYGIPNTLVSLILEPELIRQVAWEISDLCAEFALAQIEAGADIITVSEDGAGEPISRGCYEQVVMDAEKKLNDAIKNDAFTIFHLSSDITDRIDLLRDSGFHALHFESRNRIDTVRELAGKMKLIGCINIPYVLLNGSPYDVRRNVMNNIRSGIDILAPEMAVHLRVPTDNLLAISNAIEQAEGMRM